MEHFLSQNARWNKNMRGWICLECHMTLFYYGRNVGLFNRNVTYSQLQSHKPHSSIEECRARCCRILCTAMQYVWSVLFKLVGFVLPYVCDPFMCKVKANYPTGYIAVLQVCLCYCFSFCFCEEYFAKVKKKSKVIPLQARCGPEGG